MKFDKSRVFTALSADELKVGTRVLVANNIEELIHKVDAYDKEHEESATIYYILGASNQYRFRVKFDKTERYAVFAFAYVLPPVKRPFNDIAELVAYWDKHYQKEKRPPFSQPLIWVKDIYDDTHILLRGFRKHDNTVDVGGDWYSLQSMFETYTFEDNRAFGVVAE